MELNPVIQAFIQGRDAAIKQHESMVDEQLKRQQLQQQQEQMQQQYDLGQQRVNIDKIMNDARSKEAESRMMIQKADLELKRMQGMASGVIPGTPLIDTSDPTGQTPASRQQIWPADMEKPLTGPTPYAMGQYKAQIEGPSISAKFKSDLDKVIATQAIKDSSAIELQKLKNSGQSGLQTTKDAAAMEREKVRAAAKLSSDQMKIAAKINKVDKNSIDPERIKTTTRGFFDWTKPIENLTKEGFNPQQRTLITGEAEAQGWKLPNSNDIKVVNDAGAAYPLVDLYTRLAKRYSQLGLIDRFKDPEAAALRKSIEGTLGRVGKAIGGERGQFSNQDAARMRGWMPSMVDPFNWNANSAAEMEKIIDKTINNIISGASPEQQVAIKNRLKNTPKSDSISIPGVKVRRIN